MAYIDNIEKDYVMSLNDFNKPKEVIKRNALNIRLLRLLLLEKGTYPDHPDMGVDIVGKWRFLNTIDTYKLDSEISNQISRYLPECIGTQINTYIQNNTLFLNIVTNDVLLEFKVDNNGITELNKVTDQIITT